MKVYKLADNVPELKPIDGVCRACHLGKAHKLPCTGHVRRASAVRQIMHSDIVEKLTMSNLDRYQYVCTFLNDHSRYTILVLLRRKSDVHNEFLKTSPKYSPITTTQ